jgi:hypothetical protein
MRESGVVTSQPGHAFPCRKGIRTNRLVVEPPTENFVVPDQHVERSARRCGPTLEIEGEVEDLALIVGASDQVAHLNDDHRPANPVTGAVDRPGRTECGVEGREVGVHVPNRHDPAGAHLLGPAWQHTEPEAEPGSEPETDPDTEAEKSGEKRRSATHWPTASPPSQPRL